MFKKLFLIFSTISFPISAMQYNSPSLKLKAAIVVAKKTSEKEVKQKLPNELHDYVSFLKTCDNNLLKAICIAAAHVEYSHLIPDLITAASLYIKKSKLPVLREENYPLLHPLLIAVKHNNDKAVEILLEQGANCNVYGRGGNALHYAAKLGNVMYCEKFINLGVAVDSRAGKYNTSLMYAAENGHLETCKFLINSGAIVNTGNTYGITPLMLACENGHLPVVLLLLTKNAQINVQDVYGRTPLMYAAHSGNVDLCKYLIQQGADVNARDNSGLTAFVDAVIAGKLATVQYLLQQGVHINAYYGSKTPLMYASLFGQVEMCEWLISQGADIHAYVRGNNDLSIMSLSYNTQNFKRIVELFAQHGVHDTLREKLKRLEWFHRDLWGFSSAALSSAALIGATYFGSFLYKFMKR